MRGLILGLAMMPGMAWADLSGLAMRMNCATFVDISVQDVATTQRTYSYMQGLIDGIAIANGIAIPGKLPDAARRIVAVCRQNPTMSVSRAMAMHVSTETFE